MVRNEEFARATQILRINKYDEKNNNQIFFAEIFATILEKILMELSDMFESCCALSHCIEQSL